MTLGVRSVFVVPALIAIGAVASHLLFPILHPPARELEQPIAVVTAWGDPGIAAWAIYALTMLVAGIAYWRAIIMARKVPEANARRIAIVAIACALATLAAYSFRYLLSSDVYAYAAYGAIAASGHNPYVYRGFPPAQLLDAYWTWTIAYEWPSLPACIYGPAFVAIAKGVVVATHYNLLHALISLRFLEMAAFVAAVIVAALATPAYGTLLAVVIGLNPVVISTVTEGHNDALVALIIALAALVALRRPDLAGLVAGLSVALKATGAGAALALAYATANIRMFRWTAAGIVVAAVAQLVATQVAGGFQAVAATDFVGTGSAALVLAVRGVFALLLAIRALHHAAAGSRAAALACAALVVWALYPQDYPWYGVWLLPLATFTLDRREGPVLLMLTFSSTLRYLSDAYGFAAAAPWLELVALAIPLAGFIVPLPSDAWRGGYTEKTLGT